MPGPLRSELVDQTTSASVFPSEFGRFTLLGLLGQGGMGAVFEAEMRGPGGFSKPIALKVLHPGVVVATRRLGIDLLTEARLGALLHHPGIVEIYDYGEYGGQPWISMEFVDGVELSDLLRGAGPPPASVVLELALQLAEALDHAHRQRVGGRPAGFVHRDLKPSNIIVDGEGRAKITDFGISKASVVSHVTTQAGVTKGTPAYMSPEQARGQDVDGRSDLFSVGALLYKMATGRRLFRGGSPAGTVLEVLHVDDLLADRAVLREVDEAVPGLGFVLRGCLQADPDLRWGSAEELREALQTLELRVPPGPTLRRWIRDLPDCGRIYRGMRSIQGRSPVPIPRVPPVEPALLPPPSPTDLTATNPRWLAPPPRARGLRAAGLVALFGFAVGLGIALGLRLTAPPPPASDAAWRALVAAEATATERGFELAAPPPTPALEPAQARDATLPQPLEGATVGADSSFVVHAPADDVLAVELYLGDGSGVWERRRLTRFSGGDWGTKVWITPPMEGELKYWFELLRRDGRTELLGRAEAPYVVSVDPE